MRLVRGGRIVADQYVRVLTDAPIPDGVPVIVPATRFIADAAEIARREAVLTDAGFGPITELGKQVEMFETWSRFVLAELARTECV